MKIDAKTKKRIIAFQKNEITEYHIYKKLSEIEKDAKNKKVLFSIANEENKHFSKLSKFSNTFPKPNRFKIFCYITCAKVFGITFTIKFMESGENGAANAYGSFNSIPEVKALAHEEQAHERKLINLIDEERLAYMGSIVLGLNDALVEFTGALAGFTLALSNPKLIALTGAITGIAAALSMGSSEYLSTKSEVGANKHPLKASIYTGFTYLFTVVILVSPFCIFQNPLISLGVMLLCALLIIALFNFYYSVCRSESFPKRFIEMASLSFGVAFVSFLIGFALKQFMGIDV